MLLGAYPFPPFTTNQDIGYTSLRGHSLLPADHSGPIASGGIPLPPFYHESGPMLAGAYLFPPVHDFRYLPGDSQSHTLLCKESGMNSVEIYLIGLYFCKPYQLSCYSKFQSFLRIVMIQCFLFPNVGIKYCS